MVELLVQLIFVMAVVPHPLIGQHLFARRIHLSKAILNEDVEGTDKKNRCLQPAVLAVLPWGDKKDAKQAGFYPQHVSTPQKSVASKRTGLTGSNPRSSGDSKRRPKRTWLVPASSA